MAEGEEPRLEDPAPAGEEEPDLEARTEEERDDEAVPDPEERADEERDDEAAPDPEERADEAAADPEERVEERDDEAEPVPEERVDEERRLAAASPDDEAGLASERRRGLSLMRSPCRAGRRPGRPRGSGP
ncbi:hypothetical protein [Actinoplanes solisilvae]|uniref:hypothetical protein n=1 Tax=Actinoplanes solisilvae TaxID=2486853 RepID=UPI0013E2D6B3|nr:hypothetical protein [Actinoplanes solisilvae]